MFTVPFSSPPSTPSNGKSRNSNLFSLSDEPSTTPLGPPPTSLTNKSTTPSGPPPSSAVGAGQLNFSTAGFSRNGLPSSPLRKVTPASTALDETTLEQSADAMDTDHDMLSFIDESVQESGRPIDDVSIRALARGLSRPPADLRESGDVVLSTEMILQNLSVYQDRHSDDPANLDRGLSVAVQDLLGVWKSVGDVNTEVSTIGPGRGAAPLSKAVFLVSLLLTFHHPPRAKESLQSLRLSNPEALHKSIPEALLDWLRECHDIYPGDYAEIMGTRNGPAAHERFWDTIFSLSLRGRLNDAIHMMKEADFVYAVSALEDGAKEPGYKGKKLGIVQKVVRRAITVLESCPAVEFGDWNVKGKEWDAFRTRVDRALSDLETFAQDTSFGGYDTRDDILDGDGFGDSRASSDNLSVSRSSRRGENHIPWAIYENLKQLYGQCLGMPAELVSASADWVEATIGLTVWWTGDPSDDTKKSVVTNRQSLSRSQRARPVDIKPVSAYQERLAQSLRHVITEHEDPELRVNSAEPVEVGLACIFEGDLEGVLGIVRGWSSTVSTAVVEIAYHGSWLGSGQSPSKRVMKGLDQSDLMVLTYSNDEESGVELDRALVRYAQIISRHQKLYSGRWNRALSGWELAVQILNRVEDETLGNKEIAQILDGLDLTTDESIQKVMRLCDELGMPEIGRRMAERYAKHLAENTSNFGGALFYFARAHRGEKIKEVLSVLTFSSLVQSRAFPGDSEMDQQLKSMVKSPEETVDQLARSDAQAAELLSKYLSGYATLRRFYNLRDEGNSERSRHSLSSNIITRKHRASGVIMGLIASAADSIHGGLFDDGVDSVVPVDSLLVLLGEALVFLNQPQRFFDTRQIFALMKAAEDLSTVSRAIFESCEECLRSTIAAGNGADVPSPQALLKKSGGSLAASSQFSLVNSAMVGSQAQSSQSQSRGSLEGSGVMLQSASLKRELGWDWRKGLPSGISGDEVLQVLRLGLARELSRAWTEDQISEM